MALQQFLLELLAIKAVCKLTLSSCLSIADGWVQFTCIENYTLKQRTFVVCLQLDACSVAVESGLCRWQQAASSCAENGLWLAQGHGPCPSIARPSSRQQCQHKHMKEQPKLPSPSPIKQTTLPNSSPPLTSSKPQHPAGIDHIHPTEPFRKGCLGKPESPLCPSIL